MGIRFKPSRFRFLIEQISAQTLLRLLAKGKQVTTLRLNAALRVRMMRAPKFCFAADRCCQNWCCKPFTLKPSWRVLVYMLSKSTGGDVF